MWHLRTALVLGRRAAAAAVAPPFKAHAGIDGSVISGRMNEAQFFYPVNMKMQHVVGLGYKRRKSGIHLHVQTFYKKKLQGVT